MKKSILTLAICLGATLISLSTSAQNFLCTGNNILFQVDVSGLNAGDSITWYWDAAGTIPVNPADAGVDFENADGVINAIVKFTGAASTHFIASGTTVLEKSIYARVTSGSEGACSADNLENFTVYVLPTLSVDVTEVANTYCANNVQSGTITATVPTITDLPVGVSINFDWELNDEAVLTGITTTTFQSELDYNTSATPGTYNYEVSVSYDIGSGTWIGAPCGSASDATSFEVEPAPTTPTITAGTF